MQALSSQLIDEIFHIRTCAMKSLHQSNCSNFFVHPQWGPRHTPAIRGKIRPEKGLIQSRNVKDCWLIIVSIRPYFSVAWAEHRISMIFLCTLFVGPPRVDLFIVHRAFSPLRIQTLRSPGLSTSNGLVGITTTITSMLWFFKGIRHVFWLRKLCPLLIYLDFPSTGSSESYQKQLRKI